MKAQLRETVTLVFAPAMVNFISRDGVVRFHSGGKFVNLGGA
jgi:hypothetical protein